ncbi:MAG TPA: T9SS type A sorting domain-containing protein, partial [Candidatus Kapabacteria bacterium]|nr:T9SS type A sorting domain-containing protein [Candidatus Kapabacteria bacterium]
NTWLRYSENLPNCNVTALAIEESTNKMYASTYGRGVWVTNISSDIQRVATGVGNSYTFEAFPNPSQGNITLDFALGKNTLTADASIVIVDIRGREVRTEKASITEGKVQTSIHTSLENGVYFVELNIAGIQYTKKISIRK